MVKKTIQIPEGVKIEVSGSTVTVTGPKGELSRSFPEVVSVLVNDGQLTVDNKGNSKFSQAMRGTTIAHIGNMIKGVILGYEVKLEINGSGYRAEVSGNDLVMAMGYSHPVKKTAPEGVKFNVEKNIITISGIDKEKVTQMAAEVREVRRPEPYNGKGIKYIDEVIRRKAGKAAGKTEGA